jgi:hypothetical protein
MARDDFPTPDFLAAGGSPPPSRIKGSEKGAAVGSWIGVALFLAIPVGFFFWGHMPLFTGSHFPNPFFVFFALPLLFLVPKAILDTSRLARFGDPVFEPGVGPFAPGGTLEGRISLNPKAAALGEFKVTLACIHHVVTQGPKSSHVSERILWKNDVITAVLPGGILPVSMEIPVEQPSTNRTNPNDSILWRLTVRAASGHFTFLEKYDVDIGNRFPGV